MNYYKNIEELSFHELLALTLREKPNSLTVTELISKCETLDELYNLTIPELKEISGIGEIKASQLKAALEMGRRLASLPGNNNPVIKSPADVAGLLMPEMRFLDREHFKTISLNTKNRVIKIDTVAIGSLNSCIVHPREIYKTQIKYSAAAVIIAHNHPSGDVTPSKEDLDITKRLVEAGSLLGIECLDHLIIGNGNYFSMKEQGVI